MLNVQKLLIENGFDSARATLEEMDIKWSIQESPAGMKVLHLDYGIKSPKTSLITRECRGLALRFGTWEIARYGFYRFMNHGETGQDKFEKGLPVRFEEKADGSLIILWHDNTEGWIVGTRGRVFGDASLPNRKEIFGDLFWECFSGKDYLNPSINYIFEFCSTMNRIVVFYEKPHVALIGARYVDQDYREAKDDELDILADKLGVRRPKVYDFKSVDDAVENARVLPGTLEGFVAKQWDENLGRYLRVKIKGDSYKDLHMVFSAKSLNNLIRLAMRNDRSYFELFPEYLPAFDAIRAVLMKHAEEAEKTWEENKGILEDLTTPVKDKRRLFAQAVMSTNHGNYCFSRADGKIGNMWDVYSRDLEVKSRTKKYIEMFQITKIVDDSWNTETEEEDP